MGHNAPPLRPVHSCRRAIRKLSALASFDDLKVIEAAHFLRSIADGVPHGAIVEDAVRSAATLDAMARSAATGTWVRITAP